jgi:WD40 repeat protein
MSFSGDGRLLAAVNGSSLWVWEALDGTERMRVCPTGSKSCRVRGGSLALSPDGTRVAYRQRGKGLVIRSLEDGEVLSEADATDPVFSPDGSLIAARIGNGGITILESEGGTVLASRPAESKSKWRLRALAFSPDGRHLAVASCAHAELHRLEGILESGRFGRPEAAVLLPMPRTSGLSCWPQALFSRDGSQMAVLTADALTRLEVPTGALLSKVRFRHAPTVVALGPGLKRLALATGEKLRICALGEE